jgi:hypothetical protein
MHCRRNDDGRSRRENARRLSGHPIVTCCYRMSRSFPSGPMTRRSPMTRMPRMTRMIPTSPTRRCVPTARFRSSPTSHPSSRCCRSQTFRSSCCCYPSPTSHPSSPGCPRTRSSGHDPATSWTSCRSTRWSDRRRSCPTRCEHPPASSTTPSSPRHRPCSSRPTTRADPGPMRSVRRPATNFRDPGSSFPTRRSCRSGRCSMSLRCSGRDLPYQVLLSQWTSPGARHAASLPASSG